MNPPVVPILCAFVHNVVAVPPRPSPRHCDNPGHTAPRAQGTATLHPPCSAQWTQQITPAQPLYLCCATRAHPSPTRGSRRLPPPRSPSSQASLLAPADSCVPALAEGRQVPTHHLQKYEACKQSAATTAGVPGLAGSFFLRCHANWSLC